MEHHDAAEHLHVIRTLMERSAIYRHTLAPIMLFVGSVGTLACAGGLALRIETLRAFEGWWLAAALVALGGAFAIARRQAVQDGEPFWSPPTLRVTQAMVPPLAGGFIMTLATVRGTGPDTLRWLFALSNALFYGCAIHAAGFFMPRGMKLFGWLVLCTTAVALLLVAWSDPTPAVSPHLFMGGLFGLMHLAYGAYLYLTDRRKASV